jgi:WD40 repeat protein
MAAIDASAFPITRLLPASPPLPDGAVRRFGSAVPATAVPELPGGDLRRVGRSRESTAGAAMTATADGRRLFVADTTGRVDVFDVATGQRERRLQEPSKDSIHVMAVSPDGRWLACGRTRGDIQLWDLTTHKAVRLMNDRADADQERRGIVERLAFSSDSKVLFSGIDPFMGAENAGASAWDISTGKKLWTMPGVGYNVAADPRGRFVLTGVLGQETPRVSLLDAATGRLVRSFNVESSFEPGAEGGEVVEVSATMDRRFTPDGQRLVSYHDDGTVRLWDIATAKELVRMKTGPTGSPMPGGLACSPDSRWIAIRSDRTVQIWELSSGRKLHTIMGLEAAPRDLAFTADGRGLIVSASSTPVLWTVKPKDRPRIDRPLGELWEELGAEDAGKAYRLIWALIDDPKTAIRIAAANVHPAEMAIDKSKFDRLALALDAPRFAARERAEVELLRAGITVPVAWLRNAQVETKSEEVRARLDRILVARQTGGPRQWRFERMIQVLEFVGTEDSKKLLNDWAAGPPGGFLTEAAAQAVVRVSR